MRDHSGFIEKVRANCFVTYGKGVEPWEAGQWHPVELRWPYTIPPAR